MTEIALQGHARLDYAPEGVSWSIDAPLARITSEAEPAFGWAEQRQTA
jgi:hypothetical protein